MDIGLLLLIYNPPFHSRNSSSKPLKAFRMVKPLTVTAPVPAPAEETLLMKTALFLVFSTRTWFSVTGPAWL